MKRTRANDPTIPLKTGQNNPKVHQAKQFPTMGRLVDRGADGVWLVTARGETTRYIAGVHQGPWSNASEGWSRPPRPWKYDPAGGVLVAGDHLLVVYLDGNPSKPVLIPGWPSLAPDDPEVLPPRPTDADPNPARVRMVARDPASGAMTGHVDVRALDGGNAIELSVGGPAFGVGLRLLLDFDAGQIKMGRGAETHRVPLGDMIAKALQTLAQDLLTVAAAVPVVPPPPGTTQLLIDASTSLAAGAPLLSTVVTIE